MTYFRCRVAAASGKLTRRIVLEDIYLRVLIGLSDQPKELASSRPNPTHSLRVPVPCSKTLHPSQLTQHRVVCAVQTPCPSRVGQFMRPLSDVGVEVDANVFCDSAAKSPHPHRTSTLSGVETT